MAQVYMPNGSVWEYLKGLIFGFYLDFEETGNPVLLIKLEASLLVSIINGCSIDLIVRNPHIFKRSCTLYINDIPHNPFYVTWRNFGEPNAIVKDIDDVVYRLATSTKIIKLVLFNELTHPIFTTDIAVESSAENFHNWLFKVYNSTQYQETEPDEHGVYFPETEIKGYKIRLLNIDHSTEDMIQILAPEYNDSWRQNPSSTPGAFKYSDYQNDGKHGNLQELSIANILSNILNPNDDFFVSPKKSDNTEFTDFIIINRNAAIIIESKYVISAKATKKQYALSKAIDQLNRVEEIILKKTFDLVDKTLDKKLQKVSLVIKLCIVNDRIVLTDENCSAITKKFSKKNLPIFTSTTGFTELLGVLYLKNRPYVSTNLFANLIRLYKVYLDDQEEKILYRRYFGVEGMPTDELNDLNFKNGNI
ncbi:MAG: hypothetical protein ACXVAY_18550 [Mucilaginibacter sp.]